MDDMDIIMLAGGGGALSGKTTYPSTNLNPKPGFPCLGDLKKHPKP